MRAKMGQFLRILILVPILRLLLINHNFRGNQKNDSITTKTGDQQPEALKENMTSSQNGTAQSKRRQRKKKARKEKKEQITMMMMMDTNNSFNWTDVDLTQKGNCGWHKCFWRSVSNPKAIGYLVAEAGNYRQMRLAADIALDLENRFGSRHFHLDLTVVENITDEFNTRLNDLIDQPARRAKNSTNHPIYNSSQLVIERVKMAPDPALSFGCIKGNKLVTVNQVPEFKSKIPDKDAFRKQLQSEHLRLTKIMTYNPLLALDFQAFIDPAGRLYHIDLDGHFAMAKRENDTEAKCVECLSFLDNVTNDLTLTL